MREIHPKAVYTKDDFRELLEISKDKDLELRKTGNYPKAIQLGPRTIRMLGRDIIQWLDRNADEFDEARPENSNS